jgi:hypothetical protein
MIKKLRNQPYAPKWEQEEEKRKYVFNPVKSVSCSVLKQEMVMHCFMFPA